MTLPTDDANRKALPLYDFMFSYFPDAWLAVVNVAVAGNVQHNPGETLHWARHKSKDQMNTAFRHIFDYGTGTKVDTDGQHHLAKAIWRLMAQLQLDIEFNREVKKPSSEEIVKDGPVYAKSRKNLHLIHAATAWCNGEGSDRDCPLCADSRRLVSKTEPAKE
jgi:hypothetical protein